MLARWSWCGKTRSPFTALQVDALWRYIKYVLEDRMSAGIIPDFRRDPYADIGATKDDFAKFFQYGCAFKDTELDRKHLSPLTSKKRRGSLKMIQPQAQKIQYEWTGDGDASDDSEAGDDSDSDVEVRLRSPIL